MFWRFCVGYVNVVWWTLFLWCGGAFVARWCLCAVVVFLWFGSVFGGCGGVVVVLWWCGGVVVLWWCGGVVLWCCGGVGGGQPAVDTTLVSQYARAALQDARKSKERTYPELL